MSELGEHYGKKVVSENRTKLEIISSVLNACVAGELKTRIMYKCNLNSKQIDAYLDLLLDRQLIEKSIDQRGNRMSYRPTPRGMRFIHTYDELLEILDLYT